MTQPHLEVFAVNSELDIRHTFLSRASGNAPNLPDLAGWLGLPQGGVNTDEIELFPTADLGGMHLSDYVTTAFDLQAVPDAQLNARMNALEGHVLLIPSQALAGEVKPGTELTFIASLPMAAPDHSTDALQPMKPARPEPPDPVAEPPAKPEPSAARRRMLAVLVAFVLALIFVFAREFF